MTPDLPPDRREIPSTPPNEGVADSRRRRITIAVILILFIVWGLTDVRKRASLDPDKPAQHMTDLTVYTAAGAAMFDGGDPYSVTNIRGWHYIYPPLLAILLAPISGLDTAWQGVIWFGINLLLLWGCFVESRRIWHWLSDRWLKNTRLPSFLGTPWLAWSIIAAASLPVLNSLQRGQIDVFLVFFMLLGARLIFTTGRTLYSFLGGIGLALPIAIKLIPILPVAFLCALLLLALIICAKHDGVRLAASTSLGVIAGLLLFVILIPSIAVGPKKNLDYLQTFSERVLLNKDGVSDGDISLHTLRNQSFENAAYRLGNFGAFLIGIGPDDKNNEALGTMPMDSPSARQALLFAKIALIGLCIVLGVVAARRGDRLSLLTVFALSWLMMIVISPVFRGHYYVFWWLPVLVVPVYLINVGRPSLARGLAIAAAALTLAHYLFLDISGRIGLLGIGATLWFAVAAIAVIRIAPPNSTEVEMT